MITSSLCCPCSMHGPRGTIFQTRNRRWDLHGPSFISISVHAQPHTGMLNSIAAFAAASACCTPGPPHQEPALVRLKASGPRCLTCLPLAGYSPDDLPADLPAEAEAEASNVDSQPGLSAVPADAPSTPEAEATEHRPSQPEGDEEGNMGLTPSSHLQVGLYMTDWGWENHGPCDRSPAVHAAACLRAPSLTA